MKWQIPLIGLFFMVSFVPACSDSGENEPASSNQPANVTPPSPSTGTLTSDAKERRSDAAAQRLKGKVQMMTELVYPGGNTKKFSLKNVFKYDQNGNRLELVNYKADGSLNSTIKSLYDSSGKVVAEEAILANGEVDIKSVIRTDDKGNRVEQNDIKQNIGNNNLFNYKYIYKYDDQAHLIERLGYRGNGSFFFKYTFNYDADGNNTEWVQLTQTNAIIGKVVYKYDDKNNIIEEKKYRGDSTLTSVSTFTYEFDKKGNWIRQKKIQDGAVVEVKERVYKYY